MPMLDIFGSSAFNTRALTGAINLLANKHLKLAQMGLFTTRSARHNLIAVERKTQSLKVLPTVEWGGPPTKGGVRTRELISLAIPHIPVEDRIRAADVQGIRAFGSESELEQVQDLVNEKLIDLNDALDITEEYMRWGCLNGSVIDGGGTTILNLFTAMDITQEEQDFALSNSATNVEKAVVDLKRYYEANAKGVMVNGLHVFCSDGWWDAFKANAKVEKIYNVYANLGQVIGVDYRTRFVAWGVTFENVSGSWTNMAGTTVYQVPANEAIAIPIGPPIFETHYAPAGFMETVNTPGLPRYAKRAQDPKYDEYVDILAETNPLPFCTRPDLIVSLTKS